MGFVLFATASRSALGPTQISSQWVPVVLTSRAKRPHWGMKLNIHLHLVHRLRMCGDVPPFAIRLHDVLS
jgi:hypothetical protein